VITSYGFNRTTIYKWLTGTAGFSPRSTDPSKLGGMFNTITRCHGSLRRRRRLPGDCPYEARQFAGDCRPREAPANYLTRSCQAKLGARSRSGEPSHPLSAGSQIRRSF